MTQSRVREKPGTAELRGSLGELSLMDMLQLLHVSRRTGLLAFRSGETSVALRLEHGCLTGASHPEEHAIVRSALVTSGARASAALDRCTRAPSQHASCEPWVECLLRDGIITPSQARAALWCLVERTVREVAAWTIGTFSFSPISGQEPGALCASARRCGADLATDTRRLIAGLSGEPGRLPPASRRGMAATPAAGRQTETLSLQPRQPLATAPTLPAPGGKPGCAP